MKNILALLAVIVSLTCINGAGIASDTTQKTNGVEGHIKVYPLSFFDQFNPQTAWDIIDRLPGFTLDPGEDVRGFGAGAGNVLIDGARPSSKAGGITGALKRLPADAVDHIEVIRGSAGSSETAGQAVVANVVRSAKRESGRWEGILQRPVESVVNIKGEASLIQTLGAWEISTIIDATIDRRPLSGTRRTRNINGFLTFSEFENRPSELSETAISTEARRTLASGMLTLTGQFRRNSFETNTNRLGFDARLPDDYPDARLAIDSTRKSVDAELGASWSRPLSNDWTAKLISLSSVNNRDQLQLLSSERPFGMEISSSTFLSLQDSFETIFRTTINRDGNRQLKPEFGAEITYNRLDSNLSLHLNGATGVELPASNIVVKELRGEVFVNLLWKVSNKFTTETGVSAELSEITVSGDADNTQSFFFLKPFATLIYDPLPGTQLRLGARRTVGQLNFRDFAASASAADDRLLGGNPDLGPDQTTRLSASIDLRSETLGAINVEVFHEWRNDILEQVALPSGAQGLGNAGSARVWGIKSTASLFLSALIPGGLLELEAELRDSTFSDPIITRDRPVSSIDSVNILLQFRQDLPEHKFAWGLSYRAPLKGPFFFVDEISLNRDGRSWVAFVETTRFLKLKTNLEFSGIGGQNFFRERAFYTPDRSGVFLGSQIISRNRGMLVTLTVSGKF